MINGIVVPDFDRAAQLLADAWRSGHQLEALPAEARPRTIDEGYDIQDRFVDAIGDEVLGWKLGVGSVKGRRESGLGRSIAGRVVASRTFRHGDEIPLRDSVPATIEFETAFVLSEDIGAGESVDDPRALIAEARLTCEIVRSRFVDRRAVGFPSFAADDAGFDALVIGPVLDWAAVPQTLASVVVEVDGRERVRAVQGDDITDPLGAFTGFLAFARERRYVLKKGCVVSTGTMAVPFTVQGDAMIVGRLGDAELALRCVLPRDHRS